MIARLLRFIAAAATGCLAAGALAQPHSPSSGDGLLFSLSGDKALVAERAGGIAEPIFARGAKAVPDGAAGPALSMDDDLTLAWSAPGNIYAQRGTISFFFRARAPIGQTPFPIFRVGYSEHSSWDMVWLRIDWNGSGFDAFVTDTNLARTRVSFKVPEVPPPDKWTHIAFAWDEAVGVQLWIDGELAARANRKAVYDAGLFGFGPFQRIVSPYQVHSMYNFRRSGEIDELRIYDRMLGEEAAALARNEAPNVRAGRTSDDIWRLRHGWSGPAPAPLDAPVTRIRKVEFTDSRDLKQRMYRGADGIRETTWPGVYNRSRLRGRTDYFVLPDWNVYSEGGKSYVLTLPDEPWNRIEITGAAHGRVTAGQDLLFRREKGVERTSTQLASARRGGTIRFHNDVQETPIQEIAAYHVMAGELPQGLATLSYTVDPAAHLAEYQILDPLRRHIAGRFVPEERATVVALPAGAPRAKAAPWKAGMPVVHVLVPADFRTPKLGPAPTRFAYGWKNMNAGLDGIAIELPALDVKPTHGPLLPLNIRIRDPLWPERDMLDVNVSVRPGEARTLWLDTRDRILPDDASLYISIAAAGGGFGAESLAGTRVHLVFKEAEAAKAEHAADRFEQARDNFSFLVEEHPNIRLYPLYDRFERDISDVLRVDPGNAVARSYWGEKNPEQPYARFIQPAPPAGVPLWAFRQVEDLKLYRRFVDWWIDERQIDNGEFGGGLSDDTDLVNQWVPLALMGVEPDRYTASVRRVLDATYANGMWTGGLSRIRTDELHSYEEGINSVAQTMQMDWGDPTAIERGMAVAREYRRLVERNPAGPDHIVSSYFSGADIVREGTLGWQRPYSFLILHPGLLLVNYNGAPAIRSTVLSLLDSWLAHGKEEGGRWTFPAEIEWATDKSRGSGVASAAHVFWAAYSWTGDEKYLRPFVGDITRGNLPALTQLNADLLARAPGGPELARRIVAGEVAPTGAAIDRNLGGVGDRDFARFARWQKGGDKAILADLFGKEIEANSQRMHLLTAGHLWSDRVSVPNELLQRARLGGVAHRRNAYFPGNLVSWRFEGGAKAEDVAILIPEGDPRRFRVIAYNLSNRPVPARMIGAELAPGAWSVAGGADGNDDDRADAASPARTVQLERGRGTELTFAPGQTTVYDFALVTPGDDPATRPDIGISADDLSLRGNRVAVRVHSLGAKPTPAGTALIEDGSGAVLARVRFPALPAPTDLLPKTADVATKLPPTGDRSQIRVRLALDGTPPEVTADNNEARLGDTIASRLKVKRR